MQKRAFHVPWPALLAMSVALGRPLAAQGAQPTNLLINGDAETQRCTNDWTAQSSVPGWRVTRGAASVLCYSAFALAADAPRTPANLARGKALFAAPGADTAMEQTVEVDAAARGIDAGEVEYRLSAWLGGWRDRPEHAAVTATFLDRDGRSSAEPVVIADAGASARGNVTALILRAASGRVPAGTRRIRVTVQFVSGMTSYNNAYADNLSLTLNGNVGDLRAAPVEPPRARIPRLDHVYVVMMENTNFADVVRAGNAGVSIDPGMPFTGRLARNGIVLDNMWGTYHPSDQNYVAMLAGDTYEYGLTYYPNYDLAANHLGDLLNAHGKTWRAYVQSMQTPCNLQSQGSGQDAYSPDDQPFVQFQDVIGDAARCVAGLRDLEDLRADIAHDDLPDFAWIAANNWWDGEGAWYENYDVAYSNDRQDRFLQTALTPLLASAQWRDSRSLIVVTWDESGGWGWPDNRVPTILVGSPGLLRDGAVLREHVDGYDLLRTIEAGLGVGDLGRFDRFAQPLNTIFADHDNRKPDDTAPGAGGHAADDLWPTPAVLTRGSISDTFGQVTTPAAVYRGEPLTLVVPAGVDDDTVVNLERLGRVPTRQSVVHHFEPDRMTVTIPTAGLVPGFYAAWLRRGSEAPHRAPVLASILAPPLVTSDAPGVEIIGAAASAAEAPLHIREGSNFTVRYCLPARTRAADGWIGVFAAGTPADQLTKDSADAIGFWLRTPGGPDGNSCGSAAAFASELTPGQLYEVLLFTESQQGTSTAVGRSAAFDLTPALP